MFLKFITKFSQNCCYCYNTFLNHYINDGINRGNLKIAQLCAVREVKDQPYIIELYKKKALYYFDEKVLEIMARVELKKKAVFSGEKEHKNEGQINDQVIKK